MKSWSKSISFCELFDGCFSPSAEVLRPMLCRECKKSDYFVVSVLKYWAQEYEDRLADLIKEQLTRLNGTTNANKNKRSRYVTSAQLVQQVLHNWIYLVWLVRDTEDVFLSDVLFVLKICAQKCTERCVGGLRLPTEFCFLRWWGEICLVSLF